MAVISDGSETLSSKEKKRLDSLWEKCYGKLEDRPKKKNIVIKKK